MSVVRTHLCFSSSSSSIRGRIAMSLSRSIFIRKRGNSDAAAITNRERPIQMAEKVPGEDGLAVDRITLPHDKKATRKLADTRNWFMYRLKNGSVVATYLHAR